MLALRRMVLKEFRAAHNSSFVISSRIKSAHTITPYDGSYYDGRTGGYIHPSENEGSNLAARATSINSRPTGSSL